MSNRWRRGETYPTAIPKVTGFAIQIDDLCYYDAATLSDLRNVSGTGVLTTLGVAKSAASFPWSGSAAATQAAFAALFLGVAGERWPITGNVPPVFGSQDGYIRIDTGGEYEFACAPGSNFSPGQLVAPDTLGTTLLPQQVIATAAGKGSAIGRVMGAYVGVSQVLVRVFSALYSPLTNA